MKSMRLVKQTTEGKRHTLLVSQAGLVNLDTEDTGEVIAAEGRTNIDDTGATDFVTVHTNALHGDESAGPQLLVPVS